nr:MAG TPA: hypothetical protein [Caudoviricetes sp.]
MLDISNCFSVLSSIFNLLHFGECLTPLSLLFQLVITIVLSKTQYHSNH